MYMYTPMLIYYVHIQDKNVVKEFKSNAILQLIKAKRTFLKPSQHTVSVYVCEGAWLYVSLFLSQIVSVYIYYIMIYK